MALFFLLLWKNHDVMDILLIVLSLVSAYVLFVSISWLLIRLLFPKIEVGDCEEVRPVRVCEATRYPARTVRRQKNLAY